jgi:hypothetical protein
MILISWEVAGRLGEKLDESDSIHQEALREL